jgi:hypothetical protein
MNLELEFQVRQEHVKDLLKEAEQHRLWSKAKKARRKNKFQAKAEKESKSLDGSKNWQEAFEGRS